jgi:CRP/FNR family transcriptional regulator, cyclic AMP receptor protein
MASAHTIEADRRQVMASTPVSPHRPAQVLFIVKSGRIRVYHLRRDGRRLTTAIVRPGERSDRWSHWGRHVDGGYVRSPGGRHPLRDDQSPLQRLPLSDARVAGRTVSG